MTSKFRDKAKRAANPSARYLKLKENVESLVGTEYGYWRFTKAIFLPTRYNNNGGWRVVAVCVCGTRKICVLAECKTSVSCGCQAEDGRESKVAQRIREHRAENPGYYLYELAKKRADVRSGKVPFSITPNDVKIPSRCPILDLKLGDKGVKPVLTVRDRDLGYIPGNVIVISEQAHLLRNSECVKYLEWVRDSGLASELQSIQGMLCFNPPRTIERRPVLNAGDLYRSRETGKTYKFKELGRKRVFFKNGTSVPIWEFKDGF